MRVLFPDVLAFLALCAGCATVQPAPTPPPPAPVATPAPPPPPSPFVDKARPLFDGCTPKPTGRGRTYECGEVESWIVDLGPIDPANAMNLSVKALRAMMHDASPEQVSQVTLNGKPWPSARISACGDGRPESCQVGQVVTVGTEDGGSRLLGCAVRSSATQANQRCQAMLEFLASDGTPDGEPLARSALHVEKSVEQVPALLSRPLEVPKGCRVADYDGRTGVMVCKDSTSFYWAEGSTLSGPELDGMRDAALEGMRKALGANAADKGKEKRVPCVIAKVNTRCKVTEARLPDGALQIVIGAVNVGKNRSLVAACNAVTPVSALPPVCNGVFLLK